MTNQDKLVMGLSLNSLSQQLPALPLVGWQKNRGLSSTVKGFGLILRTISVIIPRAPSDPIRRRVKA